jgi:type II secretory pathway pseudopilin PulG
MLKHRKMQYSSSFRVFPAFTLAEVLIVLGVIGIVAQMTIPTLQKNIENQILTSQIKQVYTTFNQGMKLLIQNQGCEDLSCVGWVNYTDLSGTRQAAPADWKVERDRQLREVFRIDEIYSNNSQNPYKNKARVLDGGTIGWSYFETDRADRPDEYLFPLQNGSIVWMSGNDCYQAAAGTPYMHKGTCNWGLFDVNGNKKPNMFGRDIHSFILAMDGTLLPDYGQDLAKYNAGDAWASYGDYWKNNSSCVTGSFGDGCLARLMENSWVFDY